MLERLYPGSDARMAQRNEVGIVDIDYDGLRRPIRLRHLRSNNSLIVGFTHTYYHYRLLSASSV